MAKRIAPGRPLTIKLTAPAIVIAVPAYIENNIFLKIIITFLSIFIDF